MISEKVLMSSRRVSANNSLPSRAEGELWWLKFAWKTKDESDAQRRGGTSSAQGRWWTQESDPRQHKAVYYHCLWAQCLLTPFSFFLCITLFCVSLLVRQHFAVTLEENNVNNNNNNNVKWNDHIVSSLDFCLSLYEKYNEIIATRCVFLKKKKKNRVDGIKWKNRNLWNFQVFTWKFFNFYVITFHISSKWINAKWTRVSMKLCGSFAVFFSYILSLIDFWFGDILISLHAVNHVNASVCTLKSCF